MNIVGFLKFPLFVRKQTELIPNKTGITGRRSITKDSFIPIDYTPILPSHSKNVIYSRSSANLGYADINDDIPHLDLLPPHSRWHVCEKRCCRPRSKATHVNRSRD